MRYNFTNRSFIFLLFLLCAEVIAVSEVHADGDRSALRKEETADRRFLRQKFDKAMSLYEKAIGEATSAEVQASLHAKAARLYYLQRNYAQASAHFGNAMELREESLGVEDVCDYIDALRLQGLGKQAEEVCLRYAYQNVYSRSQRYMNTLDALSMRHGLLSGSEYDVQSERSCNTPEAEYWIGNIKGQPIYARSGSRFNDPGKRFYHDTEYFALFSTSKRGSAYNDKDAVGPFALFGNGRRIATVVEGKSDRKIGMTDGRLNPYLTKLLISGKKDRKGRDESFRRLFRQENGYSYCHPYLFDEDHALLFASDAPGGYGGYDLYLTRWDEEMQFWEEPVNLGPEINTAGDEIFPAYYEGHLYFASNGLPGYGGYDIYSYAYDEQNEVLIPGSLVHLPAPVNSAFNDFGLLPMDETWGYFISDRNLTTGDDIYAYRCLEGTTAPRMAFFGMSEQDAILGGQMMLSGMLENTLQHQSQNVRFPAYTPKGLVLTLYFDFNSSDLTAQAAEQVSCFLSAEQEFDIRSFRILGYADEMGSDEYNRELSLARGNTVAEALRRRINVPAEVKGCGRTPLTEAQRAIADEQMRDTVVTFNVELASRMPSLSFADRIRRNQPARRVDVYVNE